MPQFFAELLACVSGYVHRCCVKYSCHVHFLHIGPPANRVTFQDLIKQYNLTDKQLNSEIEDSDTPKLALCFDNVELYSSLMGLAIAEQADVNESRRTQAAMMKCLQIWKDRNPFQATYRALLDIVLGLEKGYTADKICQQLTQRRYMYMSSDIPPPLSPLLSSYSHNA